jgi:hypothetical protein
MCRRFVASSTKFKASTWASVQRCIFVICHVRLSKCRTLLPPRSRSTKTGSSRWIERLRSRTTFKEHQGHGKVHSGQADHPRVHPVQPWWPTRLNEPCLKSTDRPGSLGRSPPTADSHLKRTPLPVRSIGFRSRTPLTARRGCCRRPRSPTSLLPRQLVPVGFLGQVLRASSRRRRYSGEDGACRQ